MIKKILILSLVLILTGCLINPVPTSIIDGQIILVRDMLTSIAADDGVYRNEDLDFTVLKNAKTITLEEVSNLNARYLDDKTTATDWQENLTKGSSLLYFVWMEEFDAAYQNLNSEMMTQTVDEMEKLGADTLIQDWLEQNQKLSDNLRLQLAANEALDLIRKNDQITSNQIELETIKTQLSTLEAENKVEEYNEKVKEYNTLLESNNSLITEYNQLLKNANSDLIYNLFLSQIDVNLILPGQSNIDLKHE